MISTFKIPATVVVFCFTILFYLVPEPIHAEQTRFVNSEGLPAYVIAELESIAAEANENVVSISSKQRTVKKQVEIMLDYYISCESTIDENRKSDCGIELARKVYDLECHAGFDFYDPNATRLTNVKNMTDALTTSLVGLADKRVCMNHVVIPNIYTRIIAVDIAPSSIKNHAAFYEAIINNKNVVQFYYPPIAGKPKSEVKDAAFHIGFLRQ